MPCHHYTTGIVERQERQKANVQQAAAAVPMPPPLLFCFVCWSSPIRLLWRVRACSAKPICEWCSVRHNPMPTLGKGYALARCLVGETKTKTIVRGNAGVEQKHDVCLVSCHAVPNKPHLQNTEFILHAHTGRIEQTKTVQFRPCCLLGMAFT